MRCPIITCYSIVDLLPLERNDRISQQITEVQPLAFFDHIFVFLHKQPAYMREEEASPCIVGVGICLRVFVMGPVISGPFKDIVLQRK